MPSPARGEAEISLFSASDGYRFYFRRYPAPGTPRARLVFVHGIRSHGGWYTRSCAQFAAAGLEVFFLDRRGAGLNTAYRGDTPNFRRLLDDVAEFVQHLRAERGWLPVFVSGISWGGKLAVGLPYRKPNLVDGLVLLCPGLVPKVAPPLPQRARIAVARVARPWKFFPIPLNEPELFTAAPQWRAFIDTEPHGLRGATARFLFCSFSLDIYLKRAARRVTVPTFLALAEHDRIIDNARTAEFVARFPGPTETVTYPSAHHTLEFEQVSIVPAGTAGSVARDVLSSIVPAGTDGSVARDVLPSIVPAGTAGSVARDVLPSIVPAGTDGSVARDDQHPWVSDVIRWVEARL